MPTDRRSPIVGRHPWILGPVCRLRPGRRAGLAVASWLVTAAAMASFTAAAPGAQGLEWSPCAGGFQCASMSVPRDYDLSLIHI